MNRRRKITLALIGGLLFPIVCLLLYLMISDLSGWRDTVSRLASNAINRKLTIGGEFQADIGRITRVTATDITLANTEWGSEPEMASVDRLTMEIDLWSLVSGPIFLPTVEAEGAEALFETDPDGRSNWILGDTVSEPDGAPIDLRIDHIDVADLTLRSRDSAEETAINLVVSSLRSDGDATGVHQLSIGASILDTQLGLSGRLGPLAGLVNTSKIDFDVVGALGSTEILCRGSIGDLGSLAGLDLEASVTVPDLDELLALFGLPETDAGSFVAEVTAETVSELTELTVTITADAGRAMIDGTVDSLLDPRDLALDLDLSGPDIQAIAALTDIGGLPDDPFSVKGHLLWRGFPIAVDDLVIEVGENRLSADGRLGAPPLMLDTDFRFHGGGPNIAALAALGGLKLPADRFALDGKLVRVADGLQIETIEASIGPSSLSANGFVGDPPDYNGTDLAFTIGGPNLGHFSSAVGFDLPTEAFDIRGRLADDGDAIALSGVRTQVGRNTLSLDGRVTTEPGMIDTDLSLVANGPDLAALGLAAGIQGLPKAPFHVAGGITFERDGYRLRTIEGQVADLGLTIDGTLSSDVGFSGSRIRVDAQGTDLSTIGALLGDASLPSEPFRVAGSIEILKHGYGLRDIDIELGSAQGRIDGVLNTGPENEGTQLHVEARGPTLAIAQTVTPDIQLPHVDFDLRADVAFAGGEIQVSQGALVLDGNTVTVAGAIVPQGDFTGSAIDLTVEGPDFSSVGRIASSALNQEWPDLPALAYSVRGSVVLADDGYLLDSLIGTLGRARAAITGTIGRGPELSGTELQLDIDGPDASLFQAVTGTEIPVAPFQLTGGVAIADRRTNFDDVRLRLGELHAEIDGAIGPPPTFIGTDLRVDSGGPDLTLIGDLSGVDGLPKLGFRLAGRFEGNPQRFTGVGVSATLGSSDITGGFEVDFGDKPSARCEFRSSRIDLPELRQAEAADAPETTETTPTPAQTQTDFLIPDTPFDFAVLETFDLELDWEIGEFALQLNQYHDVGITAHLEDGRLEVDRFDAVGAHGGEFHSTAFLEPVSGGYRVQSRSTLVEARINLAGEDADPSQFATLDLGITLDTVGRTAHEWASNTDGRVAVTVSGGVIGSSVVDLVAADILATLLDALNPFTREEPQTQLQCAVLVANFDNGVMTLDPAAIQTDKMTILGSGTIDFATEKLKLDWVTKPRKGIGISASMITNPYIRVGGTLADPDLQMKPVEALTTTGVAVATMGISLVAKGLFDRVTAEKKVCDQALKELREMETGANGDN